MAMKQGNIAFISILIIILLGHALYVYPKNYEVLEIDAKNHNYAVIGFAMSWLTIVMALFALTFYKQKKWRILFGVEVIVSIILLFLWSAY